MTLAVARGAAVKAVRVMAERNMVDDVEDGGESERCGKPTRQKTRGSSCVICPARSSNPSRESYLIKSAYLSKTSRDRLPRHARLMAFPVLQQTRCNTSVAALGHSFLSSPTITIKGHLLSFVAPKDTASMAESVPNSRPPSPSKQDSGSNGGFGYFSAPFERFVKDDLSDLASGFTLLGTLYSVSFHIIT